MDCCNPPQTTAAGEPVQLALLFLTGITMSFGHCFGMCGPIVTAFSMAQSGGSRWSALLAMARYHSGRILSYVLIGGLLAAIGTAAGFAGATRGAEATLALLIGLFMLLLALGLLGLLPTQRWIDRMPLARVVPGVIARTIRSRSSGKQFVLGVANGFLPCGPVFAVALSAAVAQHPAQGMAAMLFYGLGTVPALVALGLGATSIPQARRVALQRVGSVLVLVIGLQLLLRGSAAWGAVPHLKVGPIVFW